MIHSKDESVTYYTKYEHCWTAWTSTQRSQRHCLQIIERTYRLFIYLHSLGHRQTDRHDLHIKKGEVVPVFN
jgi:hypothetical protein